MDDARQVIKPDPDSHFLLLPCKCGSEDVAYVEYQQGTDVLWRVQCFGCGYQEAPGTSCRHTVQNVWNDKMRKYKE